MKSLIRYLFFHKFTDITFALILMVILHTCGLTRHQRIAPAKTSITTTTTGKQM